MYSTAHGRGLSCQNRCEFMSVKIALSCMENHLVLFAYWTLGQEHRVQSILDRVLTALCQLLFVGYPYDLPNLSSLSRNGHLAHKLLGGLFPCFLTVAFRLLLVQQQTLD